MNELSLAAQIVLPVEYFQLYANAFAAKAFTTLKKPLSYCSSMQQILDFICMYPSLNRAVWTPLSGTEEMLEMRVILEFQEQMLQLCDARLDMDRHLKDLILTTSMTQDRDFPSEIPPPALKSSSADAALAFLLLCCYMARTYEMLARKTPYRNKAL